MKHQGLDHFAIAVPDTEAALKVWRDQLGFPLLYSEVVNGGTVRLTHLDLGNWHNGFGRESATDWNAELNPGPLEIGFDSFFGTPRTHTERG